ncbi:hypothetical protein HPX81_004463, partial [Salmonella enterica]|nr:hypothetical protein [Salmonella enterica]
IKGYLIYQYVLPHGSSGIGISGGQILHYGNEKHENLLLPLSVAIVDEENAMADIATNTLLNLFIIFTS